jgi:hypothetical protein
MKPNKSQEWPGSAMPCRRYPQNDALLKDARRGSSDSVEQMRLTATGRSARTALAPALSALAARSVRLLHMSIFFRWSVPGSNR